MTESAPARASEDEFAVAPRAAWAVFALCFTLMAFDFIHRQMVVAAFPLLKAEWGASDAQLGGLVSAVALTAGLGALPVAFLADRFSRVHAIVVMGVIWSLATIASAFAGSYAQLFAARAVIGTGEAGYGPAGSALLASLFPARIRATVLGAFAAAGALGAVLGVLLGGVLSAHWGWRTAFAVVGVPGLLVALAFLFVRDPDHKPASARGQGPGVAATLRAIFAARSGVAAYCAAALQLFVVATVVSWLPSFLVRAYHYDTARAGTVSAAIVLLGTAATVMWGYAADRASRRDRGHRLRIPAAGTAACFVLFTAGFGFVAPGAVQLALIAAGSLFMTVTIGSVGAVVIDVVAPEVRATAMSMITVSQNLFGMAVGPLITGVLSDRYGLGAALAVVPVFSLAAAGFLLFGLTSYEADRKRAHQHISA